MSKICSVCGYNCEDTATFCPTCGSPFPVLVQPAPTVPFQPAMQPQNNLQPPKKKNKTLWIVLGVVGGILVLLVILVLLLLFVAKSFWNVNTITSPNPSGITSNSDNHEYYYPDYDNASFHSESFVDVTTEAPVSTEPSTEASNPNETADFKEEDLQLRSIESDTTIEPATLTMEENKSYMLVGNGEILQLGDGSYQSMTDSEETRYTLGRGVGIGAPIDDFITTYGVDTTNSIWQIYTNNTYNYYYYSTTVRPDTPADAGLIIGWYKTGDTWTRMYPQDLFNYWQDGTLPECDRILMYTLYTDENFNIESISIMYGNTDYFQQFYSSWSIISNYFNDLDAE